jgi:hypothetical protein
MTDIDEPDGYRCICGHTRLEHEVGGKLCQAHDADGVVCMCSVFAARLARVQAPIEPTQEDENMATIHTVPRDELDQSEDTSADPSTNGRAEADAPDADETPNPTVLEMVESIQRDREDILKAFASKESALLDRVRFEIATTEKKLAKLRTAEAGILTAMGVVKPTLAKTSPATRAAATRKARSVKPSKATDGTTFKAKLITWVTSHPKSRLEDIAATFAGEKKGAISSTLYLAKKAGVLKTTGARGSMKWSAV